MWGRAEDYSYLVLNEICNRRAWNLTFGLIKSPPNRFQIQGIGGNLDHLTFPNGGAFEFSVGRIPTHCPRGHAIDRCINSALKYACR